MNCPHCGAPATDSYVARTEQLGRRRRHCLACGKEYYTVEVVAVDYHVTEFIGWARRITAQGGNGER